MSKLYSEPGNEDETLNIKNGLIFIKDGTLNLKDKTFSIKDGTLRFNGRAFSIKDGMLNVEWNKHQTAN